jgi:hypothetical protein
MTDDCPNRTYYVHFLFLFFFFFFLAVQEFDLKASDLVANTVSLDPCPQPFFAF